MQSQFSHLIGTLLGVLERMVFSILLLSDLNAMIIFLILELTFFFLSLNKCVSYFYTA